MKHFILKLTEGQFMTNSTLITPDLAIGTYLAIPEMHEQGFATICFARNVPVPTYCVHLPLIDGAGNDPAELQQAMRWIVERWTEGQKVFSCCRSGANRSVCVAAGAMALAGRATFAEALALIGEKRSEARTPRHDTMREVALALSP